MRDYISKIEGHISFIEEKNKKYDRDFTAYLTNSPAFSYGNKTCVVVDFGKMKDGNIPESKLIDTRYDTTLKRDGSNFETWLASWFQDNYQKHMLAFSRYKIS